MEPLEDHRMERYDTRRRGARDGVIAVLVAAALLFVTEGGAVRKTGHSMNPGVGRTLVSAVGDPAGAVADRLPFASLAHHLTSFLSPDPSLADGGRGFRGTSAAASGGVPAVTPDAFDAASIGAPPPPRRQLRTLLVTGDSMSQPLDDDLAQAFAPKGIHVIRDPHIGTGISNSFLIDWGQLAAHQVKAEHPDAVVVFIGANDGFPMAGPGGAQVACCGAGWAAIYANRVRQMADTYRQGGGARVYWLTLPAPREAARQQIARVVNAAIEVGLQPWAAQVRVIDTVPVFTPGFAYRDSMSVGGSSTIVRQADGIHLNDAGSNLLAKIVKSALASDFAVR